MKERWSKKDDEALAALEQQMAGDLRHAMQSAALDAERAWQRRGAAHGNAGTVLAAVATQRRAGVRTFAAAGLVMASLIGGLVAVRSIHHGAASDPVAAHATAPVESDDALLNNVQSDLDTTVPAAMEPLVASDVRASAPVARHTTEQKSE